MTIRAYVPNRDFDSFTAGVRVELDDRSPYVKTGYLDEVDLGDDEDEDDDEPAAPAKATAPRAAPAKKVAASANAGADRA